MTIRGTSWSTATTLLFAACTGDAARDATTLSVDTLSDGTVVVNNPVQGLWETDPGARWRIAEELRIGSATAEGADAFGDVGSLMIDQLGRFWVADRQANEVRVFDADGRFVRTVGGRGEGPAEFLDIGDIFPGPNGEVWIDDETMERFEVFDTSGTRIGGYNRDSRFWGGKWTDEGLLLSLGPHPESLEGVYTVYSRGSGSLLEPEGRVLEMPVPPPDPPMVEFKSPDGRAVRNIPPPFSPTRRWNLGSGWDAWYTNGRDLGGRYEIHRIDLESGDTLLTIVQWSEPVQVSDSMRAAALMSLWGEFAWSERPSANEWRKVPGVYPPVGSVYRSGDGTIWVRRAVGDGVEGFDVFDRDGRYLGQPEGPGGLFGMSVRWISEDHVYAVDTDELGVDYVVRLAILRPARVSIRSWMLHANQRIVASFRCEDKSLGLLVHGFSPSL